MDKEEKIKVTVKQSDNIFTILTKVSLIATTLQKDKQYKELIKELETAQPIWFADIIKRYCEITFEKDINTNTARKVPEGTCKRCGCTADDCSKCIEAQGFPCSLGDSGMCSRCAREIYIGRCSQCDSTIEWTNGKGGRFPYIKHSKGCRTTLNSTTFP